MQGYRPPLSLRNIEILQRFQIVLWRCQQNLQILGISDPLSLRSQNMKGFLTYLDITSIKPSVCRQENHSRLAMPDWMSHIIPGIRNSACAGNEYQTAIPKSEDVCEFPRLRSPSDAGDEAIILNDLHSPRPHEAPSDFRGWYKLSLGCRLSENSVSLGLPATELGSSTSSRHCERS